MIRVFHYFKLFLPLIFIFFLSSSPAWAVLSSSSTATVTSFTISNEAVGATNVTYTLTFTLSDDLVPDGDNIYLNFNLQRVSSNGSRYSNVVAATGIFGSFQYNSIGNTWVDIDIGGSSYFHPDYPQGLYQTWGLGYVDFAGDRHGILTTIPANKTVRLVVTGVTNPTLYGSYALSIEAFNFGTNASYYLELPNGDPQRSIRANIGDYCLKVKVLTPVGLNDGIPGLDISVNSTVAPSIWGDWGPSMRSDYAGAVYYYADSFTGTDGHCPAGSAEALNVQALIRGGYANPNNYLTPAQVSITLPADKDTYFTTPLRMTQTTKTITGKVSLNSNGIGVSAAAIYAYQSNSSSFFSTTTDSDGNYNLLVGGGDWAVQPQSQGNTDWSYINGGQYLKFKNDNSSETKTLNFSVNLVNSIIRFRLLKPDATPVTDQDSYSVSASSNTSGGCNGQSQGGGVYNIRVPSGSYNLNIWAMSDSIYSVPSINPITVKDNETKNIGDITLLAKDAVIAGSLKVAGVGISGISINANKRNGSNSWGSATTDASGNFTMNVVAGDWMVMPMITAGSNYAWVDSPWQVSVASGGTVSVDLTVQNASATINGSLVDSHGDPASVYGYASADQPGSVMSGPGLGGPIQSGTFSLKVPPGSYTINAGLAPGSAYTQGNGSDITIADGETKIVTLTVKTNDAVISGTIVDENGAPISDSTLFVFANSSVSSRAASQQGTVNSDGTYNISVSSGTWILGYFIAPSSGYMSSPPNPDDRFTITAGQTVTKNITLRAANSTITGTVFKSDGTTPETGAFISVDQRGGGAESSQGKGFFNGAQTDQNGIYTVKISSGSYKVRANIMPESGYISPAEETVTVAANATVTKNFTLRQSDATILGKVTLNGAATMAFVNAWADDGGFTQTMSDSIGLYSLAVTAGTTWHVGAGFETGTSAYRSEETAVTPAAGSSSTVNLALVKSDYNLPQSLTVQFDSTKPKVIELTDGTELNISANALASSGTVTLTINPKTSLPSKKGDRPIWYGYDFSATDSNNATITNFNSSITISFPYTDAQLTKLGITADDLVPSYWDSTTGTWQQVSNVTIDATNHLVIITTDHFTNYALTANYTASSNTNNNNQSSSNSSSSNNSIPDCADQLPASAPYLFEIRRSKDQAKLFFVPAKNPVNYYYIAYGPKDKPQQHGVSFDQGYSSGVLSFTINKLNAGDYYFSIRAGNGCMPGPWSDTMLARRNRTSYYLPSTKTARFSGITKTTTAVSTTVVKPAAEVAESTTPIIAPTTAPVINSPALPSTTPEKKCFRFLWWCW